MEGQYSLAPSSWEYLAVYAALVYHGYWALIRHPSVPNLNSRETVTLKAVPLSAKSAAFTVPLATTANK